MLPSWLHPLTKAHPPEPGTANLYGVILYTDRHEPVVRMIQDEICWKALNEISGNHWHLFATRGEQGSYSKSFLHAVWMEPAANRELLENFNLDSTEKLPVLMLFAEDADGQVHQRAVPIEGNNRDEVFASLKTTLELIDSVLSRFHDKNRRVETRAFDVTVEQLDAKSSWTKMVKMADRLNQIRQWFTCL